MHPMFAAERPASDITKATPRLTTRTVESDWTGAKYAVTYYDGWMI
jgi:hypothetical protein